MECLKLSVKGVVQGVGFRPFIYKLAKELSINGFVINTSDGVEIKIEGEDLDLFVARMRSDLPPLAKIMEVNISPVQACGFQNFTIRESSDDGGFTLISPDISICDDCLTELFDKDDRRYLYPFINCTNCGPRYSITTSVPYDRPNTTMRSFEMCPDCMAEYANPSNRRFHAQPNACSRCGPHVELVSLSERLKINADENPIAEAIRTMKEGMCLAIKGLGGFHLACDAVNREAVMVLRQMKRRSNKPFAVMFPDMDTIRRFCAVTEKEARLLLSSQRPIVLLRKKDSERLPDAVSPNNRYIGCMLPYTPLHYLLFRYPLKKGLGSKSHFDALVMTSGNTSEEPIVIDNKEAQEKLSGIADAFLLHNRDIFMRVDDSVVRIASDDNDSGVSWNSRSGAAVFLRRSRGAAPSPIRLLEEGPEVLGCGADLKNTFTLTKGRYAVVSQHIGDMENYETLLFFEETLANLKKVYRVSPVSVAHDLHPGYLSSKWARGEVGSGHGMTAYGIQHHYAHVASVMAEHNLSGKVLGIAFDGNGYGEDGTLWGGEFLVAEIGGYRRAGHLLQVPLPGGEQAIREPWRTALGCLQIATGEEIWDYLRPSGFIDKYGRHMIDGILRISSMREFSPLSSGAGRIFDAVSALIGLCDRNTFEGESAMALEALVLYDLADDYPVDVSFRDPMEIDFSMTFLGILRDMHDKKALPIIATKFHNTVVSAVTAAGIKLAAVNNIRKVVLSGGVFQNSFLLSRITKGLREAGLEVFTNELVPCNDGGISLGQAYILRERMSKEAPKKK